MDLRLWSGLDALPVVDDHGLSLRRNGVGSFHRELLRVIPAVIVLQFFDLASHGGIAALDIGLCIDPDALGGVRPFQGGG